MDIFKVFSVGLDNAVDAIEIQGTTGPDNYRVSTIEAIGLDDTAETSLRYEQLNGLQSPTGQLLSHVVVDVFALDLNDYVRLNSFAGDDRIDATAVTRVVVERAVSG